MFAANPVISVLNRSETVPGAAGTRRPDRVIAKGTRAVVVDYKFGSVRRRRYRTQIEEYMDLLRRMGYRDLTGYIWYVEIGEVEKV